jgi:NTE family protein
MEEILYFVSKNRLEPLRKWLSTDRVRTERKRGENWITLKCTVDPQARYRLRLVSSSQEAYKQLELHYFNLVIVDQRGASDNLRDNEHFRFVENLHYSSSPEKMFPMNRVVLILDDNPLTSRFAFQYGKLRISDFIVNPKQPEDILDKVHDLLASNRRPGKVALCLAGGGVEGLLYELGVVQALNDMLLERTVNDFDMYFGISAGSIVATSLAFGIESQELIDAFKGKKGRLPPIRPQDIYDFAVKDSLVHASRTFLTNRTFTWNDLTSVLLKTVPVGFFKGDSLRQYIEAMFKKNGLSDSFDAANRPLYIGATNQDTSEHVIFGSKGWKHVPVSKAVRASCSLTPFFKPEEVDGNWYCDGQFTRTSNFHYALEKGANLIIIVNPLVPVETGSPGYVMKKGGFFEALQALKAVINTRFLTAIHHAAESFPDVDFVLFRPEGEDMRAMGGSPMKYSIRSEIISMAYNGVAKKISHDFEIFQKKFAKHGLSINRISPVHAPAGPASSSASSFLTRIKKRSVGRKATSAGP